MSTVKSDEPSTVTTGAGSPSATCGEDTLATTEHRPPPDIEWRASRPWRWTAGTGLALVVLATAHIVAQHFTVHGSGGLRTYHEVLTYIANPVMFIIEAAFLIVVTIHAMLGIRSILLDFDLGEGTRRHLDKVLWTLGTLTVTYGVALLITLASRS